MSKTIGGNETGPQPPDQLETPMREMGGIPSGRTQAEMQNDKPGVLDTARLSPALGVEALNSARAEARAKNAAAFPPLQPVPGHAGIEDAQVEALSNRRASLDADLRKFQEQQVPQTRLREGPAIGRIVHFTSEFEVYWPAIVTGVREDGAVHLTVFTTTGAWPHMNVEASDAPAGHPDARNKWSWPVRS